MIKINETNITIMVKDFDASIRFYESIGFTLKKRWENFYAMVTAPGLTIGIHPTEPGQEFNAGDSISVGLMIDNADEARALLNRNGISFMDQDGDSGLYLHFKDPDGVTIYFTVPKWSYAD